MTIHQLGDSLGEGIKAVGLLCVGEGYPHARGERGMEHHCGTFVPRRQVHCGYCSNALSIEDDVLRANAVPV